MVGREGGRAGGKDPGGLLTGESRGPPEKTEPQASYVGNLSSPCLLQTSPCVHWGWIDSILPELRKIIIRLHFSDPGFTQGINQTQAWESPDSDLPAGSWQAT